MNNEAVPESFAQHLPPASDRMLTTWFIAALLHGILILGVSFTALDTASRQDAAPSLEVILVDDQTPKLKKNPRAKYLAQRSQHGTGNSNSNERAVIPKSSPRSLDRSGLPEGRKSDARGTGSGVFAEQMLATSGNATRLVYMGKADAQLAKPEVPQLIQNKLEIGIAANDDDEHLRLQGKSHGELWITAETRESSVAVYLDSWRRKVERVGTLNFSRVIQHRRLSGKPVIEVAIGADGRLSESFIRRSSGSPEIDRAAIAILRLASPYEPFPPELKTAHDSIRFAYEWQFLQGASQGSGVLLDAVPK